MAQSDRSMSWDDAVSEGEQQVTVEAPLERIPLLVRAGSILVMEEGKQLILHIYPPVEGSSEAILYSDANDGYGESRLDKFRMVRESSRNNLGRTGRICFPIHGCTTASAWYEVTASLGG